MIIAMVVVTTHDHLAARLDNHGSSATVTCHTTFVQQSIPVLIARSCLSLRMSQPAQSAAHLNNHCSHKLSTKMRDTGCQARYATEANFPAHSGELLSDPHVAVLSPTGHRNGKMPAHSQPKHTTRPNGTVQMRHVPPSCALLSSWPAMCSQELPNSPTVACGGSLVPVVPVHPLELGLELAQHCIRCATSAGSHHGGHQAGAELNPTVLLAQNGCHSEQRCAH